MEAIILAGGQATRLGEAARGVPKALVPIAGHPLAEYQVAQLVRAGVDRVIVSCAAGQGQLFETKLSGLGAEIVAVAVRWSGSCRSQDVLASELRMSSGRFRWGRGLERARLAPWRRSRLHRPISLQTAVGARVFQMHLYTTRASSLDHTPPD